MDKIINIFSQVIPDFIPFIPDSYQDYYCYNSYQCRNQLFFAPWINIHFLHPRLQPGIIPAPESCHAIAATINEAKKCKETGEKKVILFNLSGHGLIDMASYDKYLAGDLVNYELSDQEIEKNLDDVPK